MPGNAPYASSSSLAGCELQPNVFISFYFLPTACLGLALSRSWEPEESREVRFGFCSLIVLLSQGSLPAWAGVPAGMSGHYGCCRLGPSVLNRDSVLSPLLLKDCWVQYDVGTQ